MAPTAQPGSDGGDDAARADSPAVKPNRFVGCLVRYPCCCACSILGVALLLSIVGPAAWIASGDTVFYSSGSYDLAHASAKNQDALALAVEATQASQATEVQLQQTGNGGVLLLVFEAEGDTVFTSANVQRMKLILDKVMLDPRYPEFCQRPKNGSTTDCKLPLSPVNVFYGTENPALSTAELAVFDDSRFNAVMLEYQRKVLTIPPGPDLIAAVQAEFPSADHPYISDAGLLFAKLVTITRGFTGTGPLQNVDDTLVLCQKLYSVPALAAEVNYYFSKEFQGVGKSRHSRAILRFGMPLAGYTSEDDRRAEQKKKLTEWVQDNFRDFLQEQTDDTSGMDVLYFSSELVQSEFEIIILVDLSLAVFSWCMVFFYLWFQTRVLCVAIAGILEIVLSMPIAVTFYRLLFQFKYFSGLNAMVIYIVFAIGADDIFVFMDAFKQSMYEGPAVLKNFETRMTWTYNRAASAMLITSFTTMCAFVATAISPLVEVASFGIYAAMVIFVDFVLVISLMPACVTLWHNYWSLKPNVCCACCQPGRCGELCRSQDTTPTKLRMAAVSQRGKGMDVELATVVDPDAEVGTANPAVIASPNARKGQGDGSGSQQTYAIAVAKKGTSGASVSASARAAAANAPERRLLERFFMGPFSDFIVNKRNRIIIAVGFLLWLVPVIIFASQVEPSTTPDQFLPSDHPFQRIFDILTNRFPSSAEDRNSVVYFVWGVGGVNRDGVIQLVDPDFFGKVTWDSTFSLDTQTQQHMLDVCADIEALDFVSRNPDNPVVGLVNCIMKDFKTYAETTRSTTFPVATGADAMFIDFLATNSPDSSARLNVTYADKYENQAGVLDGVVKFVAVSTEARLRERGFQPSPVIRAEYDKFESFMATVNAKSPGVQGFQTTYSGELGVASKWVWMRTQLVFVQSAATGSIFGTCLAFVVLFAATRNIVIAVTATVTIAGILSSVLAFVTMLGWTLGTIESVSLTILAGFSVDFVVHLAHSYEASKLPDRLGKTREAFTNMGVSVLSGMITSVGASLPLFFTTLVFFSKFGGFLCLTMVFSWLWANLFFMTCMATFGPEGHEQYLGFVCKRRPTAGSDSRSGTASAMTA